ncbi:MAG: response regulator transcription factor [Myxococcota bacterium]
MGKAIRVLVVDDHPVVRNGLSAVLALHEDIDVVGDASSVATALDAQRKLTPDVTMLDFQLGDGTAVDVLKQCTDLGIDLKAVVLSTYDGAWDVYRCLRCGAKSYLLKEMPQETVLEAIRASAKGLRFIPPVIADRAAEAMTLDQLTGREFDVLQMLAEGMSNKAIAKQLGIGEGTVKTHVNGLMAKIHADSRTEAVIRAFKLGLVRL